MEKIDRFHLENCGCGKRGRYYHFKDGVEVMACNKYIVCATYEELQDRVRLLGHEMNTYKAYLQKIVDVNAMDYEYKTWAKEALYSFKE